MKSRVKANINNSSKPLHVESKAKIYVPISVPNNNYSQSHAHNHLNSTHNSGGSLSTFDQVNSEMAISELKRVNSELKQKQEIYIDKLLKLQQGLEKQHLEFKQLQDLYNQLFHSYKRKQEEISQLEQKYRESNRKRQIYSPQILIQPNNQTAAVQANKASQSEYKKMVEDQKLIIQKLEYELSQYSNKICELNKTLERLFSENAYYKNKDKMNDSRASLSSKVFEQLEEWQKQADIQREGKIKLEYQNKFLKSRNEDLENRIVELEQIVTQKQSQVVNLRQNNILLTRQNSQNRLLRSASRSPRKNEQKQQAEPKSGQKTNRVISQLYEQIKQLKKQLQKQQQQPRPQQVNNQLFIKQEQFYSFSHDDNQQNNSISSHHNNRKIHKQLFIKIQNNYQIETSRSKDVSNLETTKGQANMDSNKEYRQVFDQEDAPHFAEMINQSYESLQELPPQLQIDTLILKNMKKQGQEF